MNWKQAHKTTRLQNESGYIWVGFSPAANGFRVDSPECDDFIQLQVNMYEKEGWQLVEYAVSLSGERVNLRFRDTREVEFSCQIIKAKFKGRIDADKLADLLAKVGIEAKIEGFELCKNEC
jgi:hypothetical protein